MREEAVVYRALPKHRPSETGRRTVIVSSEDYVPQIRLTKIDPAKVVAAEIELVIEGPRLPLVS